MLLNIALLVLALYLIQEGRSQQALPLVHFFVDFPIRLLPLAYVALGLVVANFAILFFTIWRKLRKRTWPWVTTGVAALLLGVIVWRLGFDGVWTVIDPTHYGK